MADPFTPDTPHLGSDKADADARDAGRRQDPAGGMNQDRSFQSQQELDADADTSRDNHQTPRGNDAVRDTTDNLP